MQESTLAATSLGVWGSAVTVTKLLVLDGPIGENGRIGPECRGKKEEKKKKQRTYTARYLDIFFKLIFLQQFAWF